ncbi:hypothetical protein AHAS_Ahas19G0167400 [Arachis hypogaea]
MLLLSMDSKAVLDYASILGLIHFLCGCELVVFCGGVREKIASGLLEPFVSHLKFVKDEISKGGYSINCLPSNNSAFWFSKATFESTPAILERFVSLEKEILQIESSFQENALLMSSASSDEGMARSYNFKHVLQIVL